MLQNLLPIVVLSVFIGLFDGVFSSGFAINSSAIRSLAGVKAVRVVAEELNPTMQKTGLRTEQLEGTAMEALRKNGFIVLGGQEPGKVLHLLSPWTTDARGTAKFRRINR